MDTVSDLPKQRLKRSKSEAPNEEPHSLVVSKSSIHDTIIHLAYAKAVEGLVGVPSTTLEQLLDLCVLCS
jgi:hypothetical protein